MGGFVVQSPAAAIGAGASVLVVTKGAKEDEEIIRPILKNGADWIIIDLLQTTSVKNIYHTENQERKNINILSQANPFTLEKLPDNP